MGLSVSVGSLAWSLAQGLEKETVFARRDIREINRVLGAHGLPAHVEPQTLPPLNNRSRGVGLPYAMIHHLRRAVAFARQAPNEFTPLAKGADPARDPRVELELCGMFDSHLICHSDGGGFYVPTDFPDPLFDDHPDSSIAGVLGSSQRALRELVLVAPLLGIPLTDGVLSDAAADEINDEPDGPLHAERYVWLKLFEAFRLSVEHGAVVTFG
jgi:hypothetical protein